MEKSRLIWNSTKIFECENKEDVKTKTLIISLEKGLAISNKEGEENLTNVPLKINFSIKRNSDMTVKTVYDLSYKDLLEIQTLINLRITQWNKDTDFSKITPINHSIVRKSGLIKELIMSFGVGVDKRNYAKIQIRDKVSGNTDDIIIQILHFRFIFKCISSILDDYSVLSVNIVNTLNQQFILECFRKSNEIDSNLVEGIKYLTKNVSILASKKNEYHVEHQAPKELEVLQEVSENDDQLEIPSSGGLQDTFEDLLTESNNFEDVELKAETAKVSKPVYSDPSTSGLITSFLENNLKNLFTWIDAFTLVSESSDSLSFCPLELILSKCFMFDAEHTDIFKLPDFYYSQYYMMTALKKGAKDFIIEGKYPQTKIYKYDFTGINNEGILKDLAGDIIALFGILLRISLYVKSNVNKSYTMQQMQSALYFMRTVLYPIVISMDKPTEELNEIGIERFKSLMSMGVINKLGTFGKEFENIEHITQDIVALNAKYNSPENEYKIPTDYPSLNSPEDVKKDVLINSSSDEKRLALFLKTLPQLTEDPYVLRLFVNIKMYDQLSEIFETRNLPKEICTLKEILDDNKSLLEDEIIEKIKTINKKEDSDDGFSNNYIEDTGEVDYETLLSEEF